MKKEKQTLMNKLCVFCGSSFGNNENYINEAKSLGKLLADNQIDLIYGGGSIGLMGVLADSVIQNGGKVIGVIPKFLYDKEVGHDGLSELFIVETMHERKMKMAQLAEGFLALPGGIGTLEEIFEIFTWSQLKLIRHPVAFLNIDGYYNLLFSFLEKMETDGFIKNNTSKIPLKLNSVEEVIEKMRNYRVPKEGRDLSVT